MRKFDDAGYHTFIFGTNECATDYYNKYGNDGHYGVDTLGFTTEDVSGYKIKGFIRIVGNTVEIFDSTITAITTPVPTRYIDADLTEGAFNFGGVMDVSGSLYSLRIGAIPGYKTFSDTSIYDSDAEARCSAYAEVDNSLSYTSVVINGSLKHVAEMDSNINRNITIYSDGPDTGTGVGDGNFYICVGGIISWEIINEYSGQTTTGNTSPISISGYHENALGYSETCNLKKENDVMVQFVAQGGFDEPQPEPCPECGGTGVVIDPETEEEVECPTCGGSGEIWPE